MDDFGGLLAGNYGFRSQAKSAPMAPKTATRSTYNSADSILEGFGNSGTKSPNSSMPIFDKPLYDDDIDEVFEVVPGMRNSAPFDVFESMSSKNSGKEYEDLLENLGTGVPESKGKKMGGDDFDDLIPGFGGRSSPKRRESPRISQPRSMSSSAKTTVDMAEDPFIILESTSTSGVSSPGLYNNPLDQIGRSMKSSSTKVGTSSASGGILDETDIFSGLKNSMPASKNKNNENRKESPSIDAQNNNNTRLQFSGKESTVQSSTNGFEDILPKVQILKPSNTEKASARCDIRGSEAYERNAMEDQSPKSELFETVHDAWLTVSEIPLYTQPTSAPPPSRPPPPLVIRQTSFCANGNTMDNKSFVNSYHGSFIAKDPRKSVASQIDELEDFAMGKPKIYAQDHVDGVIKEEEYEANLAEAAMKEAMYRAEAKFKHAKEVREREARSKEFMQQERDEKTNILDQDSEDGESQERLNWEQEQREREERENEQKRLQREKEQELEKQKERARQAVERATREARERAAIEAKKKADEKAAAEARQRTERAAAQKVAAEARERAATEARERAAEARERAAAEAREKAAKDKAAVEAQERAERIAAERAAAARLKIERTAAEKVAAEARERAAAGARENAAAATRERQQKPEDDLESFFGMGSRATSAPKARATTVESIFDGQTQNKGGSDAARRSSSTSSSNIRKASSTANIADDLSSLFGGPPSSGEFQEIAGESEERRRSRLDRHQKTLERVAKALADKNERDLQAQREQEEKHRIGGTLDSEIKRWAAGKEGNIRALLSTLQYVLWPECGWQPVSLTDLIMGASVKKAYRKATLCIHPDKVQQKGATLQQKYIAEKVFDVLKEAWNKFNSEELF